MIAHIQERYGIACSKAGTIELLHRLCFDSRKPKGLPAKADAAAQDTFVASFEKLLNALEPDEVVYFSDAVHPEYQSRPAYGWIRRDDKLGIKRGKGRERMNLMGALNLENFDLQMLETLEMSTQTTIDLLAKLERHNPHKRLIHVVLDRAPVHRGGAVRDWLARPGCRIRLHFLPAYAPNLNAIERLWKVMHEYVTHNRYYDNFRAFAEAITRFFKSTLRGTQKASATPSTTTSTSNDRTNFGLSGRQDKTVPQFAVAMLAFYVQSDNEPIPCFHCTFLAGVIALSGVIFRR